MMKICLLGPNHVTIRKIEAATGINHNLLVKAGKEVKIEKEMKEKAIAEGGQLKSRMVTSALERKRTRRVAAKVHKTFMHMIYNALQY